MVLRIAYLLPLLFAAAISATEWNDIVQRLVENADNSEQANADDASTLIEWNDVVERLVERSVNEGKCGVSKVAFERDDKIVGGSFAKKGQYPWQISLKFKMPLFGTLQHSCGGSIIDDQWILTAAHCFINSQNVNSYIVRVGTLNHSASEPEAKEFKVAKILRHAGFQMNNKIQNDIALIKLAGKIDFSSLYVNRLCLPTSTSSHPTDGKVLRVAGWGDEKNSGGKNLPKQMKQTDLNAITEDGCRTKWGASLWADGQMMCAQAPNTSPCVGDSGGPLLVAGEDGAFTQVGIVSFGESTCGNGRPPVFTRVAYFLDWIQKTMAANP